VLQLEAGIPYSPIVREPATVLMLDKDRFALSTMRAPPDEEVPPNEEEQPTSTNPANSDSKAPFLVRSGVSDTQGKVWDSHRGLEGGVNGAWPSPVALAVFDV
jgi:hypothetical protein